jgi:hypothetical protein
MDISTYDKTALELFTILINKGPITLYATNTASKIPIGTIHRHLKEMINSEKIKVYEISKSGRKKIAYGPSVYGFIYFYRLDSKIRANLDLYFDIWIKKEPFFSELKDAGFDDKKLYLDSKMSKKIFRKYVQFYAGVEDQLEHLAKNLSEVPRDIRWFAGGFLVVRNKEYMKINEELLKFMPGYRKNAMDFLEGMFEVYARLKKMGP